MRFKRCLSLADYRFLLENEFTQRKFFIPKVSLSGFPRQSIRLSADQSQGNFSILLRSQKHFPALPGAVEDSLQLDIETPEPAGVHRPLALTSTADNGLRIAN